MATTTTPSQNSPSPPEHVLRSFSDDDTVKFGASGESLIERLFRRAFILIMEHNGVADFNDKPVEYEETIFAYYSAEEIDDPKLIYLSGADYIKLTDAEEYAVIARLRVTSGDALYYVGTTSDSFVTMAIMKFT